MSLGGTCMSLGGFKPNRQLTILNFSHKKTCLYEYGHVLFKRKRIKTSTDVTAKKNLMKLQRN